MLKRMFIVSFFFFLFFLNVNAQDSIERNANKSLNLEKNNYYLDVRDAAFNTNNLMERVKKMKILKIYPSISLTIEDDRINRIISNFGFYDINVYVDNYIKCLNKFGLYDDIEKVMVSGIKIDYLYVQATNNDIDNLILEIPKVKIINSIIN